jgi:putative transposase
MDASRPGGLFDLLLVSPSEHWKTIRTTNVMERLEGSVKRRSHKMAAAFRNEESCLLLFYAVIRSVRFHTLTMPVS